ncbi:MAG: ABC transporter permease [Roseburia sp.]|nr:ABC transporter permease [Roseburia sp.]MCM1097963.1 ABC transporter permease [Ruminococcus flavefaciens]
MYLWERSVGRFRKAWRYYVWAVLELAVGITIIVCQDSAAASIRERGECWQRQSAADRISVESYVAADFFESDGLPITYEDYGVLREKYSGTADLYYVQYGSLYLSLNPISVLGVSENKFQDLTGYPMGETAWIGRKALKTIREASLSGGMGSCSVQGDLFYLNGNCFSWRLLEKPDNEILIGFSGANSDLSMEECIFLPLSLAESISEPLFYNAGLEVGGEDFRRKGAEIVEYLSEIHDDFHYAAADRYQMYRKYSQDFYDTVSLLGWIGRVSLLLTTAGIVGILLIHMDERKKDFAVSMAVGATRRRLMAETALEIFLLCLTGGFLSVAAAGVISPMLSTSQYLVSLRLCSVGIAAAIAAGMTAAVWGVIFLCSRIREPMAALREIQK